jgi:hypothetical protein
MTKVASNANEKGGSLATTTSANPSQSNTRKTDQGEVPVIMTNRCVQKRRRGVAGDTIQLETLKVLKTMSKEMKTMSKEMKTSNEKLATIQENSKLLSKIMQVLRMMSEVRRTLIPADAADRREGKASR